MERGRIIRKGSTEKDNCEGLIIIAKVWTNYRPERSDSSGTGRKGAIISEVRG